MVPPLVEGIDPRGPALWFRFTGTGRRPAVATPLGLSTNELMTVDLKRTTGDLVTVASLRIYQFEQEEEGRPPGGARSSGLMTRGLPRVDLRVQPSIFRGRTKLHLTLPQECQVELQVYDITGRRVRALVNGRMTSGAHILDYQGRADNGRQLPNGVYFVQLRALGRVITRKLLLVR